MENKIYIPPANKMNCDFVIKKILKEIQLWNVVVNKLSNVKSDKLKEKTEHNKYDYYKNAFEKIKDLKEKLNFYKTYYKQK